MCQLLTASALLALVLLTTAAIGQPPADPNKKPAGEKADKKPADPADAAIAAALANDADVRMAKAKIQLAEAELAKARQAVTLKVLSLKATIEQQKLILKGAEDRLGHLAKLVQTGVADQTQLLEARLTLEKAKSALVAAETELKLLTGGAPVAGADPAHAQSVASALKWLGASVEYDHAASARLAAALALLNAAAERNVVKGPVPDRIRAALDKPVKLGAKGEKVTFEKAMETFKKDAELDVPVRGTYPVRTILNPKKTNEWLDQPIEIVSEGEELPVGAWFQLFEDNAVFAQRSGPATRYRFYVRDYGLLISSTDVAPPDAPALTDFWKQKPTPAKDTKPEPAPK